MGGSLAARLIGAIALAAVLVLGLGLTLDYRLSRAKILDNLTSNARVSVERGIGRIEELGTGIESSVRLLGEALQELPEDKQINVLLQSIIDSNPHIWGAALAVDPSQWKDDGGFAPYAYRRGNEVAFADLTHSTPPYFETTWFTKPRQEQQALWVDPYFEPIGIAQTMATFATPLYRREADDRRSFLGIATADIVLDELQPYLEDLSIDTAGFAFLLTRAGTLIGAPQGRMISAPMSEVLTPTSAEAWEDWRSQTGETPQGIQVHCPRTSATCELRVLNAGAGGWAVGVVYSPTEVLKPLKNYAWRTFLMGAVMTITLLALVTTITRRINRPLPMLASASSAIAEGNLDVPLPEATGTDEVSELVRAFDTMRQDLGHHIKELQDATARRSRLEGELDAAREIQMAMLPQGGRAEISDGGVHLYASVRPARAVGGDLYSFFQSPGSLLFAIGDVSDKGIPAALFMARAIALIQQWEVQQATVPPAVALAQLNESLSRDNDACMFLTLTLGVIDLRERALTWACAGHSPPLLLRDGASRELEQNRGPALGLQGGLSFTDNQLELHNDDRLLFYTDGFDEAQNSTGECLGVAALATIFTAQDNRPLGEAAQGLFAGADEFAGSNPQFDDMSLLALEIPGQRRAPLQLDRRGFSIDEALPSSTAGWLKEQWQSQGLWDDGLADMQLVLEELVCNVRDHSGLGATDSLALSLERFEDRVELECADAGRACDPLTEGQRSTLGENTDDAAIGGLGLHLITKLSDEQFYRRRDGRNILRIRRYLPQ